MGDLTSWIALAISIAALTYAASQARSAKLQAGHAKRQADAAFGEFEPAIHYEYDGVGAGLRNFRLIIRNFDRRAVFVGGLRLSCEQRDLIFWIDPKINPDSLKEVLAAGRSASGDGHPFPILTTIPGRAPGADKVWDLATVISFASSDGRPAAMERNVNLELKIFWHFQDVKHGGSQDMGQQGEPLWQESVIRIRLPAAFWADSNLK